MCTVTILPELLLTSAAERGDDPLRWRVACNRDESTTRQAALLPTITRIGSRFAIMPIDPVSGGTWIGVNDTGLVCSILNVTNTRGLTTRPHGDQSKAVRESLSRGTIIPPLLGCADIDSALISLRQLDADRYLPFRLLLMDSRELVECCSTGAIIADRRYSVRDAVMRASSALGDSVVAGPRAALFRRFFANARDPIAAQDLFHLHQWRGREEVSVRMRRADARTVSHTVIEVRERTMRLAYRPAEAPESVSIALAA
jgi:hypothetical protein